MKIFYKATGCKLNQYFAKKALAFYIEQGYEIVNNKEQADIFIIAGCVVTKKSEAYFRRYVNSIKENFPNKKIILTGCVPDYLIDSNIHYINQYQLANMDKYISIRTRQEIYIQTGCNNFCSYCIVPYYRGNEISRDYDSIIKEIEMYIKNGVKEIILTGVHIGRYAHNDYNLLKLLDLILKNTKIHRIRLSSLDINEIDNEFIDFIKKNKRIVPYFHLSMQHTENKILKLMKRNYCKDNIIDIVKYIYNNIDNVQIGADIIVGFPYENESDFNNMLKLLKELPITHYHIFRYSRREKTLAYYFDQIKDSIKKERYYLLNGIAIEKRKKFLKSLINKNLEIIIETKKGNKYTGTSENYVKVLLKTQKKLKIGSIVSVKISDFSESDYLISNDFKELEIL